MTGVMVIAIVIKSARLDLGITSRPLGFNERSTRALSSLIWRNVQSTPFGIWYITLSPSHKRRPYSGNPGDGKRQSNILALCPQRWPSYVGRLLEMRAPAARTCFAKGLASPPSTLVFACPSSRDSYLQRALHDLTALPSGKTTIQYGPPGRSASTGHIATVFGATSFLGRYLVAKLGTCFDSLRHISLLLGLVSRRACMLM